MVYPIRAPHQSIAPFHPLNQIDQHVAFHDPAGWVRGDLALSLEVLFHLVEKDVFEAYLTDLFTAAERLTKPAWLGITVGGTVALVLFGPGSVGFMFWIAGLVAVLVYIVDVRPKLNEVQRADVRQILDGGNGLLAIVNGVLDLARLESGATARIPSPRHRTTSGANRRRSTRRCSPCAPDGRAWT